MASGSRARGCVRVGLERRRPRDDLQPSRVDLGRRWVVERLRVGIERRRQGCLRHRGRRHSGRLLIDGLRRRNRRGLGADDIEIGVVEDLTERFHEFVGTGHHGARRQQHGGHCATRDAGTEFDGDVVASRETTDHVVAEELRRGLGVVCGSSDALVRRSELRIGHTDTAVDDHDHAAAAVLAGDDFDGRLRRRECKRILDEFGEQVGEVGDHVAVDLEFLVGVDQHPFVPLHLGERAAAMSYTSTGWFHRRDCGAPASTSKDSALRRMRVATWSMS